jgi:hypothetical protein
MMFKTLTIILLLSSSFGYSQKHIGDTLYYNSKKPKSDRLLLYDKSYFVWITKEVASKEQGGHVEYSRDVTYGQYKSIGDTIYFTFPDSTQAPNRYFCFCSDKFNTNKSFQFYSTPETFPPNQIDRVYKDMFNVPPPNIEEFQFHRTFKAVRRKGGIILLNKNIEYKLKS